MGGEITPLLLLGTEENKAHFGRKYILDNMFRPGILAAINVVRV